MAERRMVTVSDDQLFAAGVTEVIGIPDTFSGKNHTADGEITDVNGYPVTVKINDPSKPKSTIDLSWDPVTDVGTQTIYLKVPPVIPHDPIDPVIPPVDENTGNAEVIQAAEDAIKNAASNGEALKVIEGVFNNIKGKSDADKTEITVGVIYAAAQEGLDQKDVAQAIVNGSEGAGTFNANLTDANNETARQTETKEEQRANSANSPNTAGQSNSVQPLDITPGQNGYQEPPVTIEGKNALL